MIIFYPINKAEVDSQVQAKYSSTPKSGRNLKIADKKKKICIIWEINEEFVLMSVVGFADQTKHYNNEDLLGNLEE